MLHALFLNFCILVAAIIGLFVTDNALVLVVGLLVLRDLPFGLMMPNFSQQQEEDEPAIGFHASH